MKAHELHKGDIFRLLVCGEVVAIEPVGNRHVKVRIMLEDQGRRRYGVPGPIEEPSGNALQFTGAGEVEFICRRGRDFHPIERGDDDDGDQEDDKPSDSPAPDKTTLVE